MISLALVTPSHAVYSGPIDAVLEYSTDLACPQCHYQFLTHIPEQSGHCHSGLFYNSCEQHWFCESCASVFVEPV